ncbi:hypothetical protein [Streptomyces sp. NPDC002057]|uniref:hypothetical protein n=1 Tax=Streptomyces sp. NPDC002057 TaxID=3154664 RepID=UPI0033269D56
MRGTRRSVRTAAVATGAVAALLLPAAGAFAAGGPEQVPGAGAASDRPTPTPTPKPTPTATPAPKQKPGPAAQQASARVTLPDGNTARFYKSASWPRVEISRPNGHAVATLDPRHPAAGHHGWTYRLVDAGGHRYELAAIDTPKQGAGSSVYDFWGRLVGAYVAEKA